MLEHLSHQCVDHYIPYKYHTIHISIHSTIRNTLHFGTQCAVNVKPHTVHDPDHIEHLS